MKNFGWKILGLLLASTLLACSFQILLFEVDNSWPTNSFYFLFPIIFFQVFGAVVGFLLFWGAILMQGDDTDK